MKLKTNRAALKPTDDERLAALMMSPFVEKALDERRDEIQAERKKHAEEIAKLNARELAERNKFDALIITAIDAAKVARDALRDAENNYLRLTYERSSIVIECDRGRTIHEVALRDSAPPEVAEFVEEVRDIYEGSLGYRSLTQNLGYKRENYSALYRRLRTDAPAAQKWREIILAALREAELLPLEPDVNKIASRIVELRKSIADAGKLEFTEVLVPARNVL